MPGQVVGVTPEGPFDLRISRSVINDRYHFALVAGEVDPGQPRPTGVGGKTRFRHYLNLGVMERRLERLLSDFQWGRMDRVFEEDMARATVVDLNGQAA